MKHNYCRCTGYVKIIEGVKLAAARLRGEDVPLTAVQVNDPTEIVTGKGQTVPEIEGRFVGKSVWDVDGLAKTAGTLKYCDDYEADEFGEETMLHGAFVFAPVPHARINAVDYSAAESAPGVARIVTHKDVPGLNKIGTWTPDQPVFCSDEVRFLGDFVAMVVADTPEHARAAVKQTQADIASCNKELKTAQSEWTKAGKSLESFGKSCDNASKNLNKAGKLLSTTLTTPIVALGTAAIKSSIDFESSFTSVRKTVDATEAQFDQLMATSKKMST